ncbi:hypothetical protein BKA70DRAFT_1332517 [Coprinopsis sp. MPI-PUGE-AT-0042]|nr:hypothetical protein BKA70DRAFT_1332517 [Coprinopsis sp. MPI-PUGE-AT-0042]
MSQLPFELVCKILVPVAEPKTLKSASLVCRQFRHPSQSLLFEHVVVGSCLHAKELRQSFKDSPHLSGYVRRLDFDPKMPLNNPSASVTRTHGITGSQEDAAVILTAIAEHDRIQHFTFGLPCNGPNLKCGLAEAVVRVCEASTLHALHLRHVPLAFAKVCGPTLKRLSLDCVHAVGPFISIASPHEDEPTLPLQELSITVSPPFRRVHFTRMAVDELLLPSSRLDISRLKSLAISMATIEDEWATPDEAEELFGFEEGRRTIDLCKTSLEHIAIHMEKPPRSLASSPLWPEVKLGISKLKRLKNLDIVTKLGEPDSLRRSTRQFSEATGMQWGEWGAMLSDEGLFPRLKSVMIKFSQSSGSHTERQSTFLRRGVLFLEDSGVSRIGHLSA